MDSETIHVKAITSDGALYANVKKVYLSYPCSYFVDKPELQFEIFNKIAIKFQVPFSAVRVAGSAHLGYSYQNKRPFEATVSDLDVALLDSGLFQKLLEKIYEDSDGFSVERFPSNDKGRSVRDQFLHYSGRGIIRPDLMPNGPKRQEIWSFFNRLSNDYREHFKKISAGIYLSEAIYLLKQRSSLYSVEMDVV